MAPVPGAAWTAMNDMVDPVGRKMKWLPHSVDDWLERRSLVVSLFLPLSVAEVYDTMRDNDIPTGTALSTLALLGMSCSTYGPRTEYLAATPEERKEIFAKDLKRMKWNDEPLAYSDQLSHEDMERVEKAKRRHAGRLAHQWRKGKPQRKGKTPQEYTDAVAEWEAMRQEKAAELAGLPWPELRDAFRDYWRSQGYSFSSKEYRDHILALRRTFGNVP
jgi:hypothetical protein